MVEFIGMIAARRGELETAAAGDAPIDLGYVREFARAHEDGGFDRVLVGYGTNAADGFLITNVAANATSRIGFLLAHRPGFVQPTVAARQLATLDQFIGGRLAVHIITARDADTAGDGDFLAHDDRYRRTDEYLQVVKKTWTSFEPFDFNGEFYRVQGARSFVKSSQQPHLPIYFGGSSDIAQRVAAKHANTWALWGEPVESVRAEAAKVRGLAAGEGRSIGISVSLRPILAETEDKAWERAYGIVERIRKARGEDAPLPAAGSRGAQRLLEFGARGDILDRRLFTAIAKLTGARGNSTALVGTPEQVAESLLAYVDAGASTLLIRGFDPYNDAVQYGEQLIPLVRKALREREQAVGAAQEAVRA